MSLKSASTALILATMAACAEHEPTPAESLPKGRAQVQTWDVGEALAERKRVVVEACHQFGKNDDTVALVLAVLQGETVNCKACERDVSKDGAGEARNFSAFNLNLSYLRSIGFAEERLEALNDDLGLGEATHAVLTGIAKYGEDGFLNYHRGGSTGMADGVAYGCVEYRQSIRAVQQHILADRALMTDGRRAGLYIPHV